MNRVICLAALCLHCSACQTSSAPGAREPTRAPADRPATMARARTAPPRPAPPRRARPIPKPIIHARGVGDVLLNSPVPAHYLAPARQPEKRYVARFYADAQTMDGLKLLRTPVTVVMNRGPFHHWFENWSIQDEKKRGPMKPPLGRLAPKALKRWRAGAIITWIIITSPKVKTANGIGVGSTYADVQRSHGKRPLLGTPPAFGNDRCHTTVPGLPAYFFFKSCRAARAGRPITRISMWKTRPKKPAP